MENLVLYKMLYFFVIYSFLGWCTEVIYAAVTLGRFVNRGFLNGPVCPIYGFGMLIIITCLTPVKDNFILLFTGSVLLTSALELVVGIILEKIFKTRWWDYFDYPFNLGGYVCLAFSLMWGLGCIIIMRIVHPAVSSLVIKVHGLLAYIFLAVILTVFAVDAIITIISLLKLHKRLSQLEEIRVKLREISEELGENISKTTLAVMEEKDKLKDKLGDRYPELEDLLHKQKELLLARHFMHKRLLKAFPSLKSKRFSEALDKLRDYL